MHHIFHNKNKKKLRMLRYLLEIFILNHKHMYVSWNKELGLSGLQKG